MSELASPKIDESVEFGLVLKNGVELQLGRQDPLIRTATHLAARYPHHLVLLQAGGFLHAYGKSAYFLHKLKNYHLKVVGTETLPSIRCGLPVSGHKRRLWQVCHDFGVPYLVALGSRGNYQVHIHEEAAQSSLLDDIPDAIVEQIIEDLSQTDRLRTTRAVQMLLKPEQVSFRLKQVGNDLYRLLHGDLERFPTNHRYFVGRDIADALGRLVRGIYAYSTSGERGMLLRQISADVDLLKMLIQLIHQVRLIDATKFGMRTAVLIELGSLVGGLMAKQAKVRGEPR